MWSGQGLDLGLEQLAQPIRLLLAHTGTEFEDKHFETGPAPDYDKSCWLDVKFKLGLDFPNLPYYIDGDVKITQSNAILRHIARKHDMCGKTEEEQIRVDVMENQIGDFRSGFFRLFYSPSFDKDNEDYIKSLDTQLKQFSEYLGDNKWFAGDNLTYVDFMMYNVLDQQKFLNPKCLDGMENLKEFVARFENLEKIKEYMKSKKFLKDPFTHNVAKFGNK